MARRGSTPRCATHISLTLRPCIVAQDTGRAPRASVSAKRSALRQRGARAQQLIEAPGVHQLQLQRAEAQGVAQLDAARAAALEALVVVKRTVRRLVVTQRELLALDEQYGVTIRDASEASDTVDG